MEQTDITAQILDLIKKEKSYYLLKYNFSKREDQLVWEGKYQALDSLMQKIANLLNSPTP